MVSDKFLTRWARALLVLMSVIAVFVASGDEALAVTRAKKKAPAKKPASKASTQKTTPVTPASQPPADTSDDGSDASGDRPDEAPAAPSAASAPAYESAQTDAPGTLHSVVVIIEGTNARELDRAIRAGLGGTVNIAGAEVVAESVTIADQQTFDRPKNKREVVKAARKVAKRAKVDGVIYANVGGSTVKGYSAAILLVYKNGKVGADDSVPLAKTVRQGKRNILRWQYGPAVAALQPGLENFPAFNAPDAPVAGEAALSPEAPQLGDSTAAYEGARGDEPAVIETGEIVAEVPEIIEGLFQRRIRSPVTLKVGIEGGHRSFAYSQAVTSNLRNYSVGFVPLMHLEGEAYPFGNTSVSVLKNIGWFGMYERAFGVDSSFKTSTDNVTVSNTWANWQLGVHTRFNVTERLTIGPQLTYGYFAYRFQFKDITDQRALEVPDVRYNFVRPGLEARVPFFIVDLAAGVGYDDVISGGRVASQYFPKSSTKGVDAYVTIGFPLGKRFALDGTVRYNRWFYTMNPAIGDTYVAGGAIDQSFMASLSLVYIMGGHNEQ